MAATYGDPLQEQRYKEWKRSMTRIVNVNPAMESRRLPSGSELMNETILRNLNEAGFSISRLERMIPHEASPQLWTIICQLYGIEISLDETGRLHFIDYDIPEPETKDALCVTNCEHGFVVRDIKDDNRFLCRECDERFPRHPSLMQIKPRVEEAQLEDGLDLFREGVYTFAEAMKKTRLSTDEFIKVVKKMFPPQEVGHFNTINADGSVESGPVLAPLRFLQRVSCPKEIDAFFSNPNITNTDIANIVRSRITFPDITHVDHIPEPENRLMVVYVHFVDNTIQRVEMDERDLIANGYRSLVPFQRGRHA